MTVQYEARLFRTDRYELPGVTFIRRELDALRLVLATAIPHGSRHKAIVYRLDRTRYGRAKRVKILEITHTGERWVGPHGKARTT